MVDRAVALGQQGRTQAVAGTPAQSPSSTYRYHGLHQPALSDDGRFVAFTSDADSAAAVPVWSTGDVAGQFATSQAYVWDRAAPDPGTAVVAVSAPAQAAANGDAGHPALSHDGRYVVFQSTTTNLVPGVVLPPCTAPTAPAPVSTAVAGPEQPTTAAAPARGRVEDARADLAGRRRPRSPRTRSPRRSPAPCPAVVGNTCPAQIYRVDRTDGSIDLVSRQPAVPGATPVAADAGASDPAITYDGSTVVFTTRSHNLFDQQAPPRSTPPAARSWSPASTPGCSPGSPLLADGTSPAPLAQSAPQVSADARTVVFETTAAGAFDAAAVAAGASCTRPSPRCPADAMADVDIGTVAVGSPSGTWYVGIANDGPTPFVPATITTSNPDFAVVGGTCQLGMALAAGQSCQIHIVLTPRASRSRCRAR